MRKKLKYTKYSPKSVAPSDAVRPRARTGVTEKPDASASSRLLNASENAAAPAVPAIPPAGTASRIDVNCPKRLRHNCCPRASVTNAFGVARWRRQ